MIHHRAATAVPPHFAIRPTIGHVQSPPTAEQPRQQCRPMPRRPATHASLHLRILLPLGLECGVLVPRDIARMMVRQEDRPVGGLPSCGPLRRAPATHPRLSVRAPEDVRTGVDGIGGELVDRIVDRELPHDLPPEGPVLDRGQRDLLTPTPQEHLPQTAECVELSKDQTDRGLDAQVRVQLDAIIAGAHVANRHRREQLPPRGLEAQRFHGSLPQHAELPLAHRAFEAQQQAVIEVARVVDAVAIDQQRGGQPAQVDEVMPVTIIARES